MRRRVEVMRGWHCRRIVSMAPSITETLFALGLGDRVKGETRDSKYPPAVEQVKKNGGDIGGYLDPNFEAILALQPDLVVMLEEQSNWLPAFERLKIETLVVNHQTTDGIIESFRTIGRVCGRGPEGRQMQRDFRSRVDRIRAKTRRCPPRGCSSWSIGFMAAATRPTSMWPRTTTTSTRSSNWRAGRTPTGGAASATRLFRSRASCGWTPT